MPAATIGLFTMAIVVVAIAYLVSQMVGGDDNNGLSPADTVATQAALRTQTPQSGGTSETPQAGQTTTPEPTAATTTTPEPATATPTTAPSGGGTHTVEAGEYCGTIAEQYDITVDELLEANDMTIDDCTSLQVGQELIIP